MIGNKIKKLRQMNKMSQEEFAKKIFSTKSTISKWENGKSDPSLNDLDQIVSIFNIDIDFFVSKGTLSDLKSKKKTKRKIEAVLEKANYSGLTNMNFDSKWKNVIFLLSWISLIVAGIWLFIKTGIDGSKTGMNRSAFILMTVGSLLIILGSIVARVHSAYSNKKSLKLRQNAVVKISNIDVEIISKKSKKSIFVEYQNINIYKTHVNNSKDITVDILINEKKLTLFNVDNSVIDYIKKKKGGA